MDVKVEQLPVEPAFKPVEITIRLLTRDEVIGFRHMVGCWTPGAKTCDSKARAGAIAIKLFDATRALPVE